MKIEDYALIGDLRTSALVGRNGSIDWLCLPRTDSPACFAALLGDEQNGRWMLCPSAPVRRVSRRYREGTLILETDFETDTGTARVTDFMPLRDGGEPQLVRIVEGLQGEVEMHMQFIVRLDYGSLVPWVERTADGLLALGRSERTAPLDDRGDARGGPDDRGRFHCPPRGCASGSR